MKKQRTFLQKLQNWWHNLPHKFLVIQLFIFGLFYVYISNFLSYKSVDVAAQEFLAALLCLFFMLIHIVCVAIWGGGKIFLFHFLLLFAIMGMASTFHIYLYDFMLPYFLLSFMIQYNHNKYITYALIMLFSIPIIFGFILSVSNRCSCVPNTLCKTCMYDVFLNLGENKITLFQISEQNVLRKITRTKTW